MKKDSKIKRDFSTKVRQPFQDAIALIVHTIDYHNSFVGDKFHRRQARVLKWYLLDLKEWIQKEEKKIQYKEILIGHGLYKRVPIEDCHECADREADEILTGQTLSRQAIKDGEMTEFEKAEYKRKTEGETKKRNVWGEWNEAAEKEFFKGEKWEYKK